MSKINHMGEIVILELVEDEKEKRFVNAKYLYNDDCCIGYRYFYVWNGAYFHCSDTALHALTRGDEGTWRNFREALKLFKHESV